MNQRRAIEDVQAIRLALDASESWCCLRAASIGLTGVVGLVAALLQSVVLDSANHKSLAFVTYWVAIAGVNVLVVLAELALRYRGSASMLLRSQSRQILGQLAPALGLGALATLAIMARTNELVVLLPGLWCLFFSAGIFSTLRHVPSSLGWIGLYYATVGAFLCCLADEAMVWSGWPVGLSFGIGQCLTALLLWIETRNERR